MIDVTLFRTGNDEEEFARLQMHHTPSVGEKIWLSKSDLGQKHYKVDDVAHWVYIGANSSDHTAAVFISPDE